MRTIWMALSIGLMLAPIVSSTAQEAQLSTTIIKENARRAGYADQVSAVERGSFAAAWDLGTLYVVGPLDPDGVVAYVWFGISSAFNRGCVDPGGDFRDMVAAELTPAQIAHAQTLIEAWLAEHQQALAQVPDEGCAAAG